MNQLRSLSELSNMIGISENSFRSAIRTGKMKATKSNKTWLSTEANVCEWVRNSPRKARLVKNIFSKYRQLRAKELDL